MCAFSPCHPVPPEALDFSFALIHPGFIAGWMIFHWWGSARRAKSSIGVSSWVGHVRAGWVGVAVAVAIPALWETMFVLRNWSRAGGVLELSLFFAVYWGMPLLALIVARWTRAKQAREVWVAGHVGMLFCSFFGGIRIADYYKAGTLVSVQLGAVGLTALIGWWLLPPESESPPAQ